MRKYDSFAREIVQTKLMVETLSQLLIFYSNKCLKDIDNGTFDDLKQLKWEGLRDIYNNVEDMSLRDLSNLMWLYDVNPPYGNMLTFEPKNKRPNRPKYHKQMIAIDTRLEARVA